MKFVTIEVTLPIEQLKIDHTFDVEEDESGEYLTVDVEDIKMRGDWVLTKSWQIEWTPSEIEAALIQLMGGLEGYKNLKEYQNLDGRV